MDLGCTLGKTPTPKPPRCLAGPPGILPTIHSISEFTSVRGRRLPPPWNQTGAWGLGSPTGGGCHFGISLGYKNRDRLLAALAPAASFP